MGRKGIFDFSPIIFLHRITLKENIFSGKNQEMELFNHPIVNEFEKDVADSLGVTIYSKNKEIIGNIVKKNIELSKIRPYILLSNLTEKYDHLKKFTIRAYKSETKIDDGEEYPEGEEMPDNEKSKTLKTYGPGIGFGITFVIYFHFLQNDLINELSDYLKARRIPHSNKFLQRLIKYY